MSEVQGTAAPAASANNLPQSGGVSEASKVSGGQPQSHQSANGHSTSGTSAQPGQPVDGKSTTGKPDLADKASQAIQQGRELSQKDLATPVTRIVNGQKVTRTLNEWINASQLEQASHQRFQQANQLAKQAQYLIQLAQQNPDEFMRKTGRDPHEFSQAQLAKWLEEQQMSEEARRLKAAEERLKQYEEAEKQKKLLDEQQALSARETQEYNQMVKESLEAWKESGLPDDPYWGQRMAAEIARHQAQGIELTWKDAAAIVKHDWTQSNRRILDSFPNVEELASFLGEKVLKKLREYEVARITSKQASKSSSSQSRPGQQPASQKKSQPKFVSQSEYDEYWNKLGYGG